MAYDLYVITDEAISCGLSHAEIARQAVAGGADAIQLRDKSLPCRDLIRIAREIRAITRASGALFIVNDRMDVALAGKADGVHLGQDDLPVGCARAIAPPGFIIGVSVGNVAEAVTAARGGADYIALSPTFSTSSKEDAGKGHGLETLAAIRSAVPIPLIAIGGIGCHNVEDVIAAGADGIAVISAVVGHEDVTRAAREMKSLIVRARTKA
jgi:thiamine-phosphate pyrophosphorylase